MPTILTHALVPLIGSAAFRTARISRPLVVAGMVAAILPDADVLSLRLGLPVGHPLDHRGVSHSLSAALLAGLLAALCAPSLKSSRWAAFLFVSASWASHALLDCLSNGGRGVALLWPFSDARYFASVTPVEVSPVAWRFFSADWVSVLVSEMLWIVLPLSLSVLLLRLWYERNVDLA